MKTELQELYSKKLDVILMQRYEEAATIKREETKLKSKLKVLHNEYESIIIDSLNKEIKDE